MKNFMNKAAFPIFAGLLISGSLFSNSTASAQQGNSRELDDLRERLARLEAAQSQPSPEAEEITKMQMQSQLPDPLGAGFTGLGPAASKIYSSRLPIAIGAVGDISFQSVSSGTNSVSVTNADLLFGARVSKRLIFNSAVSLDDAPGVMAKGSRIHYAYMDLLFGDEAGVRVGNFLIPFGVTNLRFEPTLYPMVNRPAVDRLVIPTDWNEDGLLGFYRGPNWSFQAGLMNAGDISTASAGTWLRDGRQAGVSAKAESLAWVVRAETNSRMLPSGRPWPALGVSIYGGSWAQGDKSRFGNADVLMGEIHAGFSWWRFKAEALYAAGCLSDNDKISGTLARGISSRTQGSTVSVAFDLLAPNKQRAANILTAPAGEESPFYHELPIFISYEHADAQADLPNALGSTTFRTSSSC